MYMFLKLMNNLHTSSCIITHRVKRLFYKTYDTYVQNKIQYHKTKILPWLVSTTFSLKTHHESTSAKLMAKTRLSLWFTEF